MSSPCIYLSIWMTLWYTLSAENIKLQQQNAITLNSSYQESLVQIPPRVYRYVMVQALSQSRNVSISYQRLLKYGEHINSSSVGLVYMLDGKEENISTYLAAPQEPTTAQILAIPYFRKDPLPGGCCTTCAFDNDPNLYITKGSLKNTLFFSRANVNYDPGTQPSSCDGGKFETFKLEYELYMYQLQENDFSESNLFDGMWKMASPSNIRYYGSKIGLINQNKKSLFLLQPIPFQGLVYNVIVKDSNLQTQAAYAPTFVYGCDISNKNSCRYFGSWTTIIFSTIAGVIGLALCFLGHKFIRTEVFISGCLSGFISCYILLLRFASFDYTVHMLISTGAGIVIGSLLVLLWLKARFLHVCLLNCSALSGFLVACIILFSPVGQKECFSSNLVYLLTVLCITFGVPIPLAFFPKINSIIFSSLYGGFAVVMTCSLFVHAHLQYIILEFVFRAGIPSFADAYLRVPLQRNDYILSGAWAVLFVLGTMCQYFLTRNEKPLGQTRKKRRNRRPQEVNERTPLLFKSPTVNDVL